MAPITTTRSGSPPAVSAITFSVVRSSAIVSVRTCITVPVAPVVIPLRRSSPIANVVPTDGIVRRGGLSVPERTPTRSGAFPSLKMITAVAPAASALSVFAANVHVPRWIRAMLPGGKPAKSAASQPLVEPPVLGLLTSTAQSPAVTSPLPKYCIVWKSGPSTHVVGVGDTCAI